MRDACHCLLIVALSLSAACVRQAPSATDASPIVNSGEVQRLRRQRDAIRELMKGTITLPVAVQQAGGRLTLDASPNPDYERLPDLESLTNESQLIVLARPHGAPRVQLSDDARSIVTRYDVDIDSVERAGIGAARGSTESLKRLTVEVPGGRLELKEGIAAAINGPTLVSGERYLLFLQSKDEPPVSVGTPVAGAQVAPPTQAADGTSNDIFVVTGSHYEGIVALATSSPIRDRYFAEGVARLR